ncbi:MAG: DUF3800 domain-containing protein [Elusimicrobiales bacterium]
MYFCYVDESGTPDDGTTSHYVLAGISLPVLEWKKFEQTVNTLKTRWGIAGAEIHTGWLLRSLIEQKQIPGFDGLPRAERKIRVEIFRKEEILRLQKSNPGQVSQIRKNYRNTEPYTHLTLAERRELASQFADIIGGWGHIRLFAECVNKPFFGAKFPGVSVAESAFEQLVSRFECYLDVTSLGQSADNMGVLIHDNNQTTAKKLRDLMMEFHRRGTSWREITHIIETPLFVDSQLTSLIQAADICAYALRRYLENGEDRLFDKIYSRADKKNERVVGVRHFTDPAKLCNCKICVSR